MVWNFLGVLMLMLLPIVSLSQEILLNKTQIPCQEKLQSGPGIQALLGIFQTEDDINLTRANKAKRGKVTKQYVWWRSSSDHLYRGKRYTEVTGLLTKDNINRLISKSETNLKKTWIDVLGSRKKRQTYSCCSTGYELVTPVLVEYEGANYTVYRPSEDHYQVYIEGVCVPPKSSCYNGRCDTDSGGLAFVAVIDLAVSYWPPIRFLPVQKNNHCFCASGK